MKFLLKSVHLFFVAQAAGKFSLFDRADNANKQGNDGDLMTVEKCIELFKSRGGETYKKPLFWSETGNAAAEICADPVAKGYPGLTGYSEINSILPDNALEDYKKKFPEGEERAKAVRVFWNACGEALAGLAEGRSYALFPVSQSALVYGDEAIMFNWTRAGVNPQGTFVKHQYPVLCRANKITDFVQLSSTNTTAFAVSLTMKLQSDRLLGCPSLPDSYDEAELDNKILDH